MTFEEMMNISRAEQTKVKTHHKDPEHKLQSLCVKWFRLKHPRIAHALFAIPNAARRSKRNGAYMKEEGMLPGVADLILLKSNRFYGALCIEMKTKQGRQSPAQKQWQQFIESQGNKYIVCRSIEDFQTAINNYLSDV